MAQEDEMSLPYLVFRTWRNYYDKLLKAYTSIKDEEYELGRMQLHHAKENLLKSKKLLLQRGMAPDDNRISDINAMILDNLEFVSTLLSGDYKFLCQYMHCRLDLIESYEEWAAKKLEAG